MTAVAAPARERPLLMSGPMVRAVLDERKTQTRRVILPLPPAATIDAVNIGDNVWACIGNNGPNRKCLYGQPGDRLWVRETFQHFFKGETVGACLYLADAGTDRWRQAASVEDAKRSWPAWKPSIHMPRWASRLTLEITEIRVERLNDISEGDARAEGIDDYSALKYGTPSAAYSWLWDSLNAKRGFDWDVNPWVWVIVFRRVTS